MPVDRHEIDWLNVEALESRGSISGFQDVVRAKVLEHLLEHAAEEREIIDHEHGPGRRRHSSLLHDEPYTRGMRRISRSDGQRVSAPSSTTVVDRMLSWFHTSHIR